MPLLLTPSWINLASCVPVLGSALVVKIVFAAIKKNGVGIIHAASGTETFLVDLANILAENFQNCKVVNFNHVPEIEESRSVINTTKLSEIIDISSFISLENGIKKMLKP